MGLIVQKFGGTSVSSTDKIQQVAEKIIAQKEQGHRVVVVVSAMGGETDRLIQLANAVTNNPDLREYDMLVSSGEQVSVSLLAMALIAKNCPAVSLLGHQAGIHTDSNHSKAHITHVDVKHILKESMAGKVVIVAGFQGVNADGEMTTIGRGGSDTTAVALAVALEAQECQICTDVDGVHTTDPRLVPEASCLPEISFEEMLIMSQSGAKVLHPEAISLAGEHHLPLRIRSTFGDHQGTLITYNKRSIESLVKGIAFKDSLSLLRVYGVSKAASFASQLLQTFQQSGVEVEGLEHHATADQSHASISMLVRKPLCEQASMIIQDQCADISAQLTVTDGMVAKLTVVGFGVKSCDETATKVFNCLSKNGVEPLDCSIRDNDISLTISENELKKSVKLLHFELGLHKIEIKSTKVA